MYEQLIESMQAEGRRLASSQRTSIDALQAIEDSEGDVLDFSIPISENDRAISDLDTLVSSLIKFTEGFREDRNWSFVPRIWISEFRDALKNTANSFDNLATHVASIEGQHGGLGTVDASTFSVLTGSGTAIDFKKLLSSISTNVDSAYATYFRMRPAISAPRLSEFSDLFGFFATRKTELDSLSRELARLAETGRALAEETNTTAKTAEADQETIAKSKDESIKAHAEIQNAVAKATKAIASIEETTTAAETLSEAVSEYKADFEEFQQELNSRNADYNNKKAAFEKLKSLLDQQEKKTEQITAQAEDMLKGATNAGLAGSFSNKQLHIETELTKARRVYYVSIGLLVFLTLPIFIYSFPREYVADFFSHLFGFSNPQVLARDPTQSEYQQILNFIGRAVFLIPGLMFVRFASSRHARLFRLREDYAYKYSIASSVDGFMKQSKTYADDIAAACYYELTYNPADYMDEKTEDSRLMNPLFEKMMSRLESRMVRRKTSKAAEVQAAD